jgi:Lrp/AsnC family transcriptional regulator for asnA, asnC and gidA
MANTVTSTDRTIIRQLQRNARMSYAELSRETGIPESTVRRRMDRLQQRGVIEFSMLADPSKLGYELRAMIGLRVELQKLAEIAARLREMTEVNFAAFLTGNFDIMIQVIVRSQENLVGFLTQKLATIDGVRSTETFVMPYIIKPMTSWLLPEVDAELRRIDDDLELEEGDGLVSSVAPTPSRPRGRRGRPRRASAGDEALASKEAR